MTGPAIEIRPIRTEEDHDHAIARITKLMNSPANTPEADELEILVTLVHAYEAIHFPIDPPDPIAAIEFRMENGGWTRKDLEPMIGSRARVSEVLSGKRKLTLTMIRKLSQGMGIPADVLIGNPLPAPKAAPAQVSRRRVGTGKSGLQRRSASA